MIGRVPAAVDNGLGSPEWQSLRNALLFTGGLFLLQQLMWPTQWTLAQAVAWRVDDAVRERILAASFEPVGIAALEDQQTLDELGEIVNPMRGLGFSPGAACAGLLALVARYLQWAVAAALLGIVFSWWAGVAAAAGALAVRIGMRSGLGRLGAFEGSYAPVRRRRDYFRELLHRPYPAKEVRIFGLLPWAQARHREQALAAVQPVWKARRRGARDAARQELHGRRRALRRQWQRLALARAMMRARPLLLVLDEPTSALDAHAEHVLFERYADSARAVAEATGGVAIFVSHRFSTVRMADLIVVVDEGKIVEQGTHEQLLAHGGLYAELFSLQAAAYG